ncbi:MAG: type IV toxin-antitoxin system AbiEi family antitoxin domain-containing protein [Rhabdochlamydiaceae bacterium]|nr:type IV toxin-antitoxin system AbiEi family antitoxin domain-containing protein [Rhabdochlamydiaceae bacterium]
MAREKSESIRNKAIKIFEKRGGMLKTSEAISEGIHPRILYELLEAGHIMQIQRGLYALINLPDMNDPDFVIVAKKVPVGVICLVSALYYHHLTVQIPKWIDIAVPQKYRVPVLDNPPVRFHWLSDSVFYSGIEMHDFNGIEVRIFSPEKTIVDCFRLRKKIGMDIAIEGLKMYLQQKKINLPLIRKLAQESRIIQVIEPYIAALTHDQS